MPQPEQRTCGGCVFFERAGDPESRPRAMHGQCRRYALRPGPPENAQWPETQDWFSCGEWSDAHPADRANMVAIVVRIGAECLELLKKELSRRWLDRIHKAGR